MSDFRKLSNTFLASPQIETSDVAEAAAQGVALIVNNRPDGEDPDAPQGDDIEAASRAAGIDYLAIPVGHSGFSLPQIDALAGALAKTDGTVLGYCRSGTRSTLLWAMARAKMGDSPDSLEEAAGKAGYSLAPVRPTIDMLAGEAK